MCDICNLIHGEDLTLFYYKDNYFTMTDCKICNLPILILNSHKNKLNEIEKDRLQKLVNLWSKNSPINIRFETHDIDDHWYGHLNLEIE